MTLRESKPPPPLLEPLLSAASYHRVRGQLDEALDAYKKALLFAADAEPHVRASVYAHIGSIKRAQAKPQEAELNFEKALEAVPTHHRSLDELASLREERRDARGSLELRRRILALLEEPGERADELERIARLHERDLGEPEAAIEALEAVRAIRPEDRGVLGRLRALYERTGAWAKVNEVLTEQYFQATDARERGAIRTAQAEVALDHLHEDARGLQLLDGALEEDPDHVAALQRLVTARIARGEIHELERLYARLIDLHAEADHVVDAWLFCRRLAALRTGPLNDPDGAIDALTGALRCKPDDVESRAELASLFAAQGDGVAAVRELERAAAVSPRRVETHRALFEQHVREGRHDRAWLAAMALEALGGATLDHERLAAAYRTTGLIRPENALDGAAWDTYLRARGHDPSVAEILRAVGPAAIAAKVDELASAKHLTALDAAHRADDGLAVAQTFAWASHVLGVAAPDLYVFDDVPGAIAAVQSAAPAVAVAAGSLRGRPLQELAFLAARHLTYYRPEHYPLVFYPTVSDLSRLFVAAVTTFVPDVPVAKEAAAAVAELRARLESGLDAEHREALADGVHALERQGGRADLLAYIRGVELAACRAGLVLAGDLAVAARVVRSESRAVAELTGEDRFADLLAFTAEDKLAVLREWLGVAVRPSIRPPKL